MEPVLEREPANASATFYLGYVLHAQGKLDQAIVYHRRASEFPQLAPNALYNWACALALQGDSDAAIEKLAKSIDLGFSYTSDLTDDPDLISLFEREDFKKLQLQANRNRATKQIARQLDFWLGRWIVTNEQGDVVGKNVITATENGRVITEKWTSSQGNTGTSFNYYHPQEQQWKQTWVDGSGGVIEYAGEFKAGKMQYQGHMVSPQGQPVHSRMTFTPSGPEKVEQLIEKSDDGKVWEVYFQGTYQRDQAVPWAAPAGGPICTEVDIADEVDSDL